MSERNGSAMNDSNYYARLGGLPGQTQLLSSKAVFTTAYAVIPRSVMTDIVTSVLPHWEGTRAWIIARPMTGFSETFAQYVMEVEAGGGSLRPEPDSRAQAALFVTEGEMTVELDGKPHQLRTGSFAYLPAGSSWSLRNRSATPVRFHWIRKVFQVVDSLAPPPAIFTHESEQQMVAIGRALMTRPRLLGLDEPAIGLAPRVVSEIFEILGTLTRAGLSLLLVEQNVQLSLRSVDHAYLLQQGEVVLQGPSDILLESPMVRAAYLALPA